MEERGLGLKYEIFFVFVCILIFVAVYFLGIAIICRGDTMTPFFCTLGYLLFAIFNIIQVLRDSSQVHQLISAIKTLERNTSFMAIAIIILLGTVLPRNEIIKELPFLPWQLVGGLGFLCLAWAFYPVHKYTEQNFRLVIGLKNACSAAGIVLFLEAIILILGQATKIGVIRT